MAQLAHNKEGTEMEKKLQDSLAGLQRKLNTTVSEKIRLELEKTALEWRVVQLKASVVEKETLLKLAQETHKQELATVEQNRKEMADNLTSEIMQLRVENEELKKQLGIETVCQLFNPETLSTCIQSESETSMNQQETHMYIKSVSEAGLNPQETLSTCIQNESEPGPNEQATLSTFIQSETGPKQQKKKPRKRKRKIDEENVEESSISPNNQSQYKLGHPLSKDRAERVRRAMELVEIEKVSIRKAAKECNLSYSFLQRRTSGEVDAEGRHGPNPVFSKEEEAAMATWLLEMAKREMGLTPKVFLDFIQKMVWHEKKETPFTDGRPGYDWYYAFKARNCSLEDTMVESPITRTKLTQKQIENWYARFRNFLSSMNLLNKRSQIWNADEIIFSISSKTSKVMEPIKTAGNIQGVPGSKKECLTTILCANAEGNMIPPFLVYPESASKGCDPNKNGLIDTTVDHSKFGTLTDEIFKKFLHHFDKHVGQERPVLLLIESVSTYISMDVFQQAKQYQVEFYRIMPNATSLMQPMEISVFRPLKTAWSQINRTHYKENPDIKIDCHNFSEKLKDMYHQINKPLTIIDSFKSTGICPLDGTVTTERLKQTLSYTVREANKNEDN